MPRQLVDKLYSPGKDDKIIDKTRDDVRFLSREFPLSESRGGFSDLDSDIENLVLNDETSLLYALGDNWVRL